MTDTQSQIISQLNEALRMQLTCINQCFLHARILKHGGLMELADGEFKESLDSMRFADQLVERVLSLGGMPHMQPMDEIKVGRTRSDMLAYDLQLKEEIKEKLKASLVICSKDENSIALLTKILATVDEHIQYINEQRGKLDVA